MPSDVYCCHYSITCIPIISSHFGHCTSHIYVTSHARYKYPLTLITFFSHFIFVYPHSYSHSHFSLSHMIPSYYFTWSAMARFTCLMERPDLLEFSPRGSGWSVHERRISLGFLVWCFCVVCVSHSGVAFTHLGLHCYYYYYERNKYRYIHI